LQLTELVFDLFLDLFGGTFACGLRIGACAIQVLNLACQRGNLSARAFKLAVSTRQVVLAAR